MNEEKKIEDEILCILSKYKGAENNNKTLSEMKFELQKFFRTKGNRKIDICVDSCYSVGNRNITVDFYYNNKKIHYINELLDILKLG